MCSYITLSEIRRLLDVPISSPIFAFFEEHFIRGKHKCTWETAQLLEEGKTREVGDGDKSVSDKSEMDRG